MAMTRLIRSKGSPSPPAGRLGPEKLISAGPGGRRGTAELLAFSAEHGITSDIELLPSARAPEALTRLDLCDVRYRFVLDLADLG